MGRRRRQVPVAPRSRVSLRTSPNMAPSWSRAGIEGLCMLRDELDEETAPWQDRLHQQEVDVMCARGRFRQAPHNPCPQACPAQPVGRVRREAPIGAIVEGEVKNATEFGLSSPAGDVDGWSPCPTSPGESRVRMRWRCTAGRGSESVVLDVDVEKERISLGMKHLEKGAPAAGSASQRRTGGRPEEERCVTVTVLEVARRRARGAGR